MRAGFAWSMILIAAIFTACVRYETVEAPAEIRLGALDEAGRYIGMEYEYGGQDSYEKGIDCSGLIVNCYAADNPKIKAFGRLLLEQKRGL